MVIEVADSSAVYDRTVKVPQYARAGISEVWVIDLAARVIEVYRRPAGREYSEHLTVVPGSSLQLPGLVDLSIATDAIL